MLSVVEAYLFRNEEMNTRAYTETTFDEKAEVPVSSKWMLGVRKMTAPKWTIAKETATLKWVVLGVVFLWSVMIQAQHVSVRNNVVYDAALTPNLGFDVAVDEHWSVGANVGFRPWPTDDNKEKKWRHLLVAPEFRYWNAPQSALRLPKSDSLYRAHMGYWGLNLIYSHYNVAGVKFPFGLYKTVRNHRLQGDLFAVGAFYGHTWRLSPWLRLEVEAGMGFGYAWADKYDCPHCGAYLGKHNKPFLLPKLALNLVLDHQQKEVVAPSPPFVAPTTHQNVEK